MNFEVSEDIEMTLDLIEVQKVNYNKLYWGLLRDAFTKISPCYLFSNENLREYYPYFQINDSDVLTVCSSGDQVLSSILYGAKSVDTFDSNKLTYYNLMMKIAAIKTLDYSDFIKFYSIHDFDVNRYNYYKKISKMFSNPNIRVFWDKIFESGNENFSWVFFGPAGTNDIISKRIPYMDVNNYNILKDKIDDCVVNFKNVDLIDIYSNFDKKYSFINLSNILTYIKSKDDFGFLLKYLYKDRLQDNGSILVNYTWSSKKNFELEEFYNFYNVESIIIPNIATDEKIEEGSIKVLKKNL